MKKERGFPRSSKGISSYSMTRKYMLWKIPLRIRSTIHKFSELFVLKLWTAQNAAIGKSLY